MSTLYTDEEIREIIASALNTYCFQNIWNETKSEFRSNIVPSVIYKNSVNGNVFLNSRNIPLPTDRDGYYVYLLSASTTYGIVNKKLDSRWISTEELCNEEDILVEAYHISGKMFHKGYVYIYPLEDNSGYLLAINRKMANTVIPYNQMLIKNKVVDSSSFTMEDILKDPNLIESEEYTPLVEDTDIDDTTIAPGYYIHLQGTHLLGTSPFDSSYEYNFVVDETRTQFAVCKELGTSYIRKVQQVHVEGTNKFTDMYTAWEEYYNKIQVNDGGIEFYSYYPLVRVTIYYDSDITNKLSVRSYKLSTIDPNATDRDAVMDYILSCSDLNNHVNIFIDGYETKFTGLDMLPSDCYVDVVHDENVVLSYDIDLTKSKYNNIFYSDRDKTYKNLVHIPKELNPDNEVFTHNTMTIYVRAKLKDGSSGHGVYLHRCAKRSVTQVTHNDIAIPTYILDAFRDYLETQDITLHILVRRHDKDNVLIRDKSYIDLLYTLDDDTIIDHLMGRIEPRKLNFWMASELEKTKYIEMMFDVPNIITPENMFEYVEGLGYYETISLICKRVHHTVITEWFRDSLYFSKPYIYQRDHVYPIIYINKEKIDSDHILVSNDTSSMVGVGVDSTVEVHTGDIMSVELYLDGNNRVYAITPEEGESYVDLPYKDYNVLEELVSDIPIKGINKSYTKYYKEFTSYIGNILEEPSPDIPGYIRLTFGPNMYGRRFIIQNNKRVYRWKTNIDSDMQYANPIILDLEWNIYGSPEKVPIWYTPYTLVFLNGKYLIRDVDYVLVEITDYNNNVIGKQIAIQNLSYLKDSGNIVEYYVTSAEIDNHVNSYVVDGKAFDIEKLALLFTTLSTVHVDGHLEPDAVNMGNYISIPKDSCREGAPFEVITVIPSIVKNFIDQYHDNDDIERIEILNEYFYGKRPEYPEKIILDESHRCYSLFTSVIIRDIISGANPYISLDPDSKRFEQELKDYDKYKEIDLAMNDKYDLRFVDVLPHYRNFEVEDVNQWAIISNIVAKLLPADDLTNYTADDVLTEKKEKA